MFLIVVIVASAAAIVFFTVIVIVAFLLVVAVVVVTAVKTVVVVVVVAAAASTAAATAAVVAVIIVVSATCVPELVPVLHVRHFVPDCLDEVVVSGNLRGDHAELLPTVSDQDRQHRRHLVLQAGSQLQLQATLGLVKRKQNKHEICMANCIVTATPTLSCP